MKINLRPIALSLSPNTEFDDVLLAVKTLLNPISYMGNSNVRKLEENFANKFGKDYRAFAINSGRSAEYIILKSLGIGSNDEVIVPAFTCVAVPNSVLWLKAVPRYVDIGSDYNLDAKDLKKKITNKTKAVIVQHTFGIPAKLKNIKDVLKEEKVFIIEDCAHALGASYEGKEVGTLGDIAFFSFGRDKIISSVFGGMILVSKKNKDLINKIEEEIAKLKYPSIAWTVQQLLHPILFALILPLYDLIFGKVLLLTLQKLKILSKAIYLEEKKTKQPQVFPQRMPNPLAILASHQLEKLEKYNKYRKVFASSYFDQLKYPEIGLPTNDKGSAWLRFPIQVEDRTSLVSYLKKHNILVGDWYKTPIMPVKDLLLVGYKKGDCPNAEKICGSVVNLPTYPSLSIKQSKYVVRIIKQWLNIV